MMNKIIRTIKTIGLNLVGALFAFYIADGFINDFIEPLPVGLEEVVGMIFMWFLYKTIITAISNFQNN